LCEIREVVVDVVEIVHGQCPLAKVALALGATGRFASRLHSRQEERDEDTNDGDHDEQFNERESRS
jgi:hypothetical protein